MDPDRKRRRTASDFDESNASHAVTGDSPSSFKHEQSRSSEGTPNNSSNLLLRQAERASENTGNSHAPSSEDEEEAENHTMTRMLVDPTGRLCKSSFTCPFARLLSGWRIKARCAVRWGDKRLIFASRHMYRHRIRCKDIRVPSESVKIPLRIILVHSRCRAHIPHLCVNLELSGSWSRILIAISKILSAHELTAFSICRRHGIGFLPAIDSINGRVKHGTIEIHYRPTPASVDREYACTAKTSNDAPTTRQADRRRSRPCILRQCEFSASL